MTTLELIIALCMSPLVCTFPEAPKGQVWIERHVPRPHVIYRCIAIKQSSFVSAPELVLSYSMRGGKCPKEKE